MALSLKKAFLRAANATMLTAIVSTGILYAENENVKPGYSIFDRLLLSVINYKTNDSCVYAGHGKPLDSQRQKHLLTLYNEASKSQTGKDIVTGLYQDGSMLCFADNLNKVDQYGFFSLGSYDPNLNIVKLNPNPVRYNNLPGTLVHEGRHHQQDYTNLGGYNDGNYLESDLVIRNWVKEADARLAAILYSYEMLQEGNAGHMVALSADHRTMLEAFLTEMMESDDIHEAMRATVRAFRDNEALAENYDINHITFMNKVGYHFNPEEDVDELLTDEMLMKMGQVGHYGNYMDEGLMEFIRNSVTMDDYKNLRRQINEDNKKTPVSSPKALSPSVPMS